VRDERGLAALTLWRHHHPAGGVGGNRLSMVGAHDVQEQVQAGTDAGRGQHVPAVDVAHGRIDVHGGKAGGEIGGMGPVRRSAATFQQAGLGEHERAGADRRDPGAGGVRRTQHIDHPPSPLSPTHAGHEHGVAPRRFRER